MENEEESTERWEEFPKLPYHILFTTVIQWMLWGIFGFAGYYILYDELGWSNFQWGIISAATSFGIAVSYLVFLYVTQHNLLQPMKFAALGGVIATLSVFCLGLTILFEGPFSVFVFLTFTLAASPWSIIVFPLLDWHVHPSQRVYWNAFVRATAQFLFMLSSVGTFVLNPTGPALACVYFACAAIMTVVYLSVWLMPQPESMPKYEAGKTVWGEVKQLFVYEHFNAFLGFCLVYSFLAQVYSFAYMFLEDEFGWSYATSAVITGAMFITVVPTSTFISGLFTDWLKGRQGLNSPSAPYIRERTFLVITRITYYCMMASIIILSFAIWFGPVVWVILTSIFLFLDMFPSWSVMGILSVPPYLSHYAATISTFGLFVAGGIGAPIAGYTIDQCGFKMSFLIFLNLTWFLVLACKIVLHCGKTIETKAEVELMQTTPGPPMSLRRTN